MNHVDWNGCYDGSWQSAPLVPEAYAHPAKVSFNLAERIYRHMLTEGWLAPGDVVIDPFGGIGGFAFHAALYGMRWTGVELEQKFVDLGNQNLALWRNRYAPHFPGYGSAVLVQGDSRRLVEVVTGAGGVVSSPPYAGFTASDSGFRPPHSSAEYGRDESKPSAQQMVSTDGYGSTPGQLGAMPAGVVSSPPYAEAQAHPSIGSVNKDEWGSAGTDIVARRGLSASYGSTPGNIGNDTADTFWSAAAVIVQQCYAILRPGGYAAWVTGDFVRNKQRVPFGQQWLDLCVSCGFEPALWAVAWKSEHNGTQAGMFGEVQEMRKERVSFFRRLANAKRPETAIVNEDVIFVRKP